MAIKDNFLMTFPRTKSDSRKDFFLVLTLPSNRNSIATHLNRSIKRLSKNGLQIVRLRSLPKSSTFPQIFSRHFTLYKSTVISNHCLRGDNQTDGIRGCKDSVHARFRFITELSNTQTSVNSIRR